MNRFIEDQIPRSLDQCIKYMCANNLKLQELSADELRYMQDQYKPYAEYSPLEIQVHDLLLSALQKKSTARTKKN